MLNSSKLARALAVACLAALPLHAAETVDLDRTTPVPADQPIPIMDFFRPSILRSPRLNRAGTHMAAIITAGRDRHELLIYDLDTQTSRFLSGGGDRDIYSCTWLNDKWLLFMLSHEKLYAMGMMAMNVEKRTDGHPLLQYYGASLVGIPERNRMRPLVWMRYDFMRQGRDLGVGEIQAELDLDGFTNLYQAGATSEMAQKVEEQNDRHIRKRYPVPPGLVNGYLADKDGELAFSFTGDGDGFLTMHRFESGKWIKTPLDLEVLDVQTVGDRPGEIIVQTPRQEGKPRAVHRMDAVTGKLGDLLLQDARYDFSGWFYRDDTTREIVGAFYDRSGPHVTWFDESYRAVQKMLESSFPKQVVRIIDGDTTGRLLISTWSDREPVVYHWVNPKNRTAGLIKRSAPWIEAARMQPMNVMQFKTRDGRTLDAYVTLPVGASKTNPAPLVVLPHGGPWVRDTWGFNGEVQFLASRGYAVLQPNYRGSSGYDWMFPEEDRYAFRKMHDDVTDATKTLMRSGVIDPKRMAIMGGSFGAYLALSGVAHEPELYRCAVTIAGVFDWEQVMKAEKHDQYSSSSYAYMKRKLGDPKNNKETFEMISPLRHVSQVRVPVFVSHGKEDFVAEVAESRRLISELKKHGIPHESLFVSGEGHGMARLTNQVELYSRVESFLAKHLSPSVSVIEPAPAGAK